MAEHATFVAHRHEDDHLVAELKALLKKHDCKVRDSSVTLATPNNAKAEAYIKAVILGRRILRSGKMFVIVSPQTKNHWWVDWEIRYAAKKGKRIVGIWAPGAERGDLPAALDQLGDAMVDWNAENIVAALEGENIWVGPRHTPPLNRTIKRAPCTS